MCRPTQRRSARLRSRNNVMLGYYRDEEATRKAAPDGWFRTGDLGVMHPDGYVELRDRAKDIIISGGENISSVEVEQALASHPAPRGPSALSLPHGTRNGARSRSPLSRSSRTLLPLAASSSSMSAPSWLR